MVYSSVVFMGTTHDLFVYFGTAHDETLLSNRLIRTLGRSEWCHVYIGNHEETLVFARDGDRVWPTPLFVGRFPRLSWMVTVPCGKPVELKRRYKRFSPWPTALRYFTGIPIPTNDCVQRTSRLLQTGGVYVPRAVCTPSQLWDWFRSQGFTFIDMTGECECPKVSIQHD